jgi:DeoR/GlpR family transcriptional regulator of sugar metabolism
MLTAERREIILKLVNESGSVHVPDLSQRFDVSSSTVRRDLEWLEEQGAIKRTYGGAVAIETAPRTHRKTDPIVERIGRTAADLVEDGETVFIGPGRLCRAAAKHLCNRGDVTVITNSLEVAWILYQDSAAPLIMTGGPVMRPGGALVGQIARQALDTMRADRVIIDVAGISPVEGFTSDQLPQAELLRPLFESVAQVTVLATADRLGRAGAAWLGPISDADTIVTDREASSAILWDLSETGVKVRLA